jgi:hypothetical protein
VRRMALALAWLAPVVIYRLWRAVPRSRVNSATPAVVATPQAPTRPEREPAESGSGTAYQLLAGVAGVLGTGIGGAAFLTFVGGTIFLARFRGAGISAPSAVPLVERERLLAVGADQLVAFLVAGAGVAFFVCIAYSVGGDPSNRTATRERALLLLFAVAGVLITSGGRQPSIATRAGFCSWLRCWSLRQAPRTTTRLAVE